MRSAITVSLVPEARGGPFVYWENLPEACVRAAALGFDAVEIFPRSPKEFDSNLVTALIEDHALKIL